MLKEHQSAIRQDTNGLTDLRNSKYNPPETYEEIITFLKQKGLKPNEGCPIDLDPAVTDCKKPSSG